MQITNGTVEYERTVKPADYEKRGARLTLSFAVEEGSDAAPVIAKVFDMAVAEVHHRIGLNGPAYVRRMAEIDTAPGPASAVLKTDVPTMPAGHNDDHIREALQAKRDAALAAKREAAAAPQENPTAPTVDDGPQQPSATSSPALTVVADPLTIVAPTMAPVSDAVVDITDSDLHTAVHQTLDRGVTAIQVRNLTDTFTGVVGQSMRTLPQDQRPAFLAALKELQPDV